MYKQGVEGGSGAELGGRGRNRGLDVYSEPCHPFLALSGRLKLLAKQTVNPGAGGGGAARMWIGAGSSQVGDYLIPLRRICLAFFFVTQTLEEGCSPLAAPRGPCLWLCIGAVFA